jgi:hypothetical protein
MNCLSSVDSSIVNQTRHPRSPIQRFGFIGKAIGLCCLAVGLMSCNTGKVRFLATPAPPLPNVLAGQNEFKLTFTVINPTDDPVVVHAIKVRIKSQHFTNSKSGVCETLHYLKNPLLTANGGKWTVEDFEFSESSIGISDPCHCTKARDCKGNVWIQLLSEQSDQPLPGPKTHYQIYFAGSGGLSDMTVSEQSN